jgi:hypothetical protein
MTTITPAPPVILMTDVTFFNAVGWIATYTGAAFDVMNPRAEDIRFDDIASALSKQCRYGGHCIEFYSVAEHCVHVAERAPMRLGANGITASATELSELLNLAQLKKEA